jgi:hypothetical protein
MNTKTFHLALYILLRVIRLFRAKVGLKVIGVCWCPRSVEIGI